MAKTISTPIVVPEAVQRKASESDYPMETVMRILKEQAEKPMSARRQAAVDAEIRRYGAKQAKKVGVKESEIVRIIHESRARRRTP